MDYPLDSLNLNLSNKGLKGLKELKGVLDLS